jgi:hypothetical protein
MTILFIHISVISIIIFKSFYKTILFTKSPLFSQQKNTKFLWDTIQIESVPFYFYLNSGKMHLFSILLIILIGFLSVISNDNIAYCMNLEDKKSFCLEDLKFLRQKMRESEQLTNNINILNDGPKYFENQDQSNYKIDYNYIYDFKKYKITRVYNNPFIISEKQYGPSFIYLKSFEERFNNTKLQHQKVAISLEILISKNKKICNQDFKIFNILNKSLENEFQTPIQTKFFINKIINNTIENGNNTYDILYCIKSNPYLPFIEKKKLLIILRKAFESFLFDYSNVDNYFIKKLPENFDLDNINNQNFIKNFEKFHKLNLENFTLMKNMCLIKEKKFENIKITSPTPSEQLSYSSGEDLAIILDGNMSKSDVDSPFSFESSFDFSSDEETEK